MLLDILAWKKVVKPDGWSKAPKGRLRLRIAGQAALYIKARQVDDETGEILNEGEALVGFDTTFDVRSDMEMSFKLVGATDAYVYDPQTEVFAFDEDQEVFTNVDKMPLESEQTLEIQKALRLFLFEQQHNTRLMREERAALETRRQARLAEPETVPIEAVQQPASE